MGRILFWVVLGFVAYIVWRWWGQQRLRDEQSAATGQKKIEDTMVPCDVCGLNVPQSEAFPGNGRWYCSDEHRRRGPA
ncbi:MAG TPA: PP0621 family protein [Burkholderiaceae bacterium]|nr:PP0621 family protein [Burkholderiaceae bacterium]